MNNKLLRSFLVGFVIALTEIVGGLVSVRGRLTFSCRVVPEPGRETCSIGPHWSFKWRR